MVSEIVADGLGNSLAASGRQQKSCSVSADRPTGLKSRIRVLIMRSIVDVSLRLFPPPHPLVDVNSLMRFDVTAMLGTLGENVLSDSLKHSRAAVAIP